MCFANVDAGQRSAFPLSLPLLLPSQRPVRRTRFGSRESAMRSTLIRSLKRVDLATGEIRNALLLSVRPDTLRATLSLLRDGIRAARFTVNLRRPRSPA